MMTMGSANQPRAGRRHEAAIRAAICRLCSPLWSSISAADLGGRPRGEDAAELYSEEPTDLSGCSYGGDGAAVAAAAAPVSWAHPPVPLLRGPQTPADVEEEVTEHTLRMTAWQQTLHLMCEKTSRKVEVDSRRKLRLFLRQDVVTIENTSCQKRTPSGFGDQLPVLVASADASIRGNSAACWPEQTCFNTSCMVSQPDLHFAANCTRSAI